MMAFEIGDIVEQSATSAKYKVEGISEDGNHLWLRYTDDPAFPFTGVAATYQKAKDFFEPGLTYTRFAEWSIDMQKSSQYETFTVKCVETDEKGKPYAFGQLNGNRWVIMTTYNFENGKWVR